jgi:uncharacterized lipoprotein YddW (UPF0748 family)
MKKLLLPLFILIIHFTVYPQYSTEFRAVKLTNVDSNILFTDANISQGMDYLASLNVNAVLAVVWNGGYTLYPSTTMDSLFSKPIHPNFAGRDQLERVIIEAHRNGIEVYPWFEYGFAAWYSGSGPATGGHILQTKPEWASKLSSGQITKKNGFDWMSPIHPEVQDFMNKLITEVMEYDIDGIEFSDRIPAMPVEGGYEPYTVSLYQTENGGQNPPVNYYDNNWKRWRADKMNQWYKVVRQLMNDYSTNLFVSSSPSVYPWSYDNYLQDVKTWIDSGICDQMIPQLYRYSFSDYLYELNQAVALSGPQNLHKLFGGLLMNLGLPPNEYVIDPGYLLSALQANRDRGVMGEAFFYYEGLRKNNNLLGDTLKATFYSQPAFMPGRHGVWRPKPEIKSEDESGVAVTGSWTSYPMSGYEGQIIRTNDISGYASIEYTFDVPFSAYFDVYTYLTPNTTWSQNVNYVLYPDQDSIVISVNQADLTRKGWQKTGTVYLSQGNKRVLKIDNTTLEAGKWIAADAVMIMINRKLSPDVIISGIEDQNISTVTLPDNFTLSQNYPNPFNSSTIIRYSINSPDNSAKVILKVYDVLGKETAVLLDTEQAEGSYEIRFNAEGLSSGIYLYQLNVNGLTQTKKLILLR